MSAWIRYREKSQGWITRLKDARRAQSFEQPFDTGAKEYRERMQQVLMQYKFADCPAEYFRSDQFPSDLTEEQYRRVDRFHACLVPWLSRVFSLGGSRVVEVGSGTGSSTLAFARYVDAIHCFEPDPKAVSVAKTRLSYWDIKNVAWENGLFDRQADLLASGGEFDIVLLVAVLEHLHFHEFKDILSLAFECLRPGGVILVAETPNRLSVTDFHTSWIDFFQWLPPEVAREYYRFSPRSHFANELAEVIATHGKNAPATTDYIVRWGRGVSYHDFELALGREVHDMIVLDGWEDELRPLAPIIRDDEILTEIFRCWQIKAHRAFSRSWLYFVLRKPG